MASPGFYSLIQYQHDPERAERANLGVVLFCPALGFAEEIIASDLASVRHFFGSDVDERRVRSSARALTTRLKAERPASVEDVAAFMAKEAGSVVFSEARAIRIAEPAAILRGLFAELVERPKRERRKPARPPHLERIFEPLRRHVALLVNQHVTVPILNSTFVAPYAYRNGCLNLIRPEGFSSNEDSATTLASRLAVQGHLLHRHPDMTSNLPRRLVVVGSFVGVAGELQQRVGELLAEHDVRLVPEEKLQEFASEVVREAHD